MSRRRGGRRRGSAYTQRGRGRGRGSSRNIETIGIDISDEEEGYGRMPEGYNADNLVTTSRRRRMNTRSSAKNVSAEASENLVPLPSLLPEDKVTTTSSAKDDQKRKKDSLEKANKRSKTVEEEICIIDDNPGISQPPSTINKSQPKAPPNVIEVLDIATDNDSISDNEVNKNSSHEQTKESENIIQLPIREKSLSPISESLNSQTFSDNKSKNDKKEKEKEIQESYKFSDDDFSKFEDDNDIEFENMFMQSYNTKPKEIIEPKVTTEQKRVFIMNDSSSSDDEILNDSKDLSKMIKENDKERQKLEQEIDAELDEALQSINETKRRTPKRFLRKKDETLLRKIERQTQEYNLVDRLTGLQEIFSSIINNEIKEVADCQECDDESQFAVFTVVFSEKRKFMKLHIDKPFSSLVKQLSESLNIPVTQMVLYHNTERIDNHKVTPRTSNLISGGTLDLDISNELSDSDYIRLKFRYKAKDCYNATDVGYKIPYEGELNKVMKEFAAAIEEEIDNLTFRFDGDVIKGSCTPSELDLDDDDVIDVLIANV